MTNNEAIGFLQSRVDLIDKCYPDVKDYREALITAIKALEQQPKMGEWLEKEVHGDNVEEWQSARCSVCDKYHTTPYMYYFSHYEYCPHCGSKMEVSDAE